MKKIMFNDKYGLTEAVLQGRKTMTRRFIKQLLNDENPDISDWGLKDGGKAMITLYEGGRPMTDIFPMYQPGEVVALAQRGIDIYHALQKRYGQTSDAALGFKEMYEGMPMWNNKMFVPADLCPSRIQITNIKVERLQDINGEDCLREGVLPYGITGVTAPNGVFSPREAFAALIDKVSGKGTWERNPWVFAYSFELVK